MAMMHDTPEGGVIPYTIDLLQNVIRSDASGLTVNKKMVLATTDAPSSLPGA